MEVGDNEKISVVQESAIVGLLSYSGWDSCGPLGSSGPTSSTVVWSTVIRKTSSLIEELLHDQAAGSEPRLWLARGYHWSSFMGHFEATNTTLYPLSIATELRTEYLRACGTVSCMNSLKTADLTQQPT